MKANNAMEAKSYNAFSNKRCFCSLSSGVHGKNYSKADIGRTY